jgi:hypothetical protein
MPNRYIREGINSSRAVASLGLGAEIFYRRMLLVIDDFGRYEVDYMLIRSAAYPVHPNVTETDIAGWLAACQKAGLLAIYEVDERKYVAFAKTEPPRARNSKYPDPPPGLVKKLRVRKPANISSQPKTNAPDTNANANTDATTEWVHLDSAPERKLLRSAAFTPLQRGQALGNRFLQLQVEGEAASMPRPGVVSRCALTKSPEPPGAGCILNIAPAANKRGWGGAGARACDPQQLPQFDAVWTGSEPVLTGHVSAAHRAALRANQPPAMSTRVNICSHVQTNVPYSNTITNTNADTNTNAPSPRAREELPCRPGAPTRRCEDWPEAEIPSWDEFWAYCQSLHCGLGAEWFARDKWEAGNQEHWRRMSDWRAYARRCRAWWEADGRPATPPAKKFVNANAKNANNRNPNDRNANANHSTTGPDRNAGTYNAHYDTEAAKLRVR